MRFMFTYVCDPSLTCTYLAALGLALDAAVLLDNSTSLLQIWLKRFCQCFLRQVLVPQSYVLCLRSLLCQDHQPKHEAKAVTALHAALSPLHAACTCVTVFYMRSHLDLIAVKL